MVSKPALVATAFVVMATSTNSVHADTVAAEPAKNPTLASPVVNTSAAKPVAKNVSVVPVKSSPASATANQTIDKSKKPPRKGKFTDDEISPVVKYVKTTK